MYVKIRLLLQVQVAVSCDGLVGRGRDDVVAETANAQKSAAAQI